MKGAAKSGGTMVAVWPASIASGALVAQHVAGKATRDTLFLTHFGLELLPAAMIGAAVISLVAVVGIARALARYGPARVVPIMFGSAIVLFLGEWWLSLHSPRGAAVAVYVHTAIFSSAGVSAFWSLVNERFDPHVAKQVVGRIASGGTIGGVVGGLAIWRASAHLSVPMMLALLALINAVGMVGAVRLIAGVQHAATKRAPEPLAGSGWKVTRETPYLRDLAFLVFSGAVLQALLDWLLSAHASGTYGKGPRLLAFFALFNMIVGVLAFLAQTGLSRWLLQRLGLAGTLRTQPITVVLGAVLALFAPELATVVLLRGGEAVTRNSLYRSAYELFYTPLPTAKKRATKTLIDVGADRVGTAVGSVALLAIVHLGTGLATRAVLVASVALASLAWLIAARLQDGYVAALASSLKSGLVVLGDDEIEDLTTKRTLAETTALLDRDTLLQRIEEFQRTKAAGSEASVPAASPPADAPRGAASPPAPPPGVDEDPLLSQVAALRGRDVARIKATLAAGLDPSLAAFAVPLLGNDAVARDALRALRKIAPRATGQLLDALLDPGVDPRIRRRIPRVLKGCRTQRAASGLLLALRDPAFDVRAQVALALAQMHDEAAVVFSREEVFDLVVHELSAGRATWHEPRESASEADALRAASEPPTAPVDSGDEPSHIAIASDLHRGLAHVFTLLGLVLDREPLAMAHRAMRSEEAGLRGTAHEYLEVVLPARFRELLLPLFGDVATASAGRRPARETRELADELRRSSASLPRPSR